MSAKVAAPQDGLETSRWRRFSLGTADPEVEKVTRLLEDDEVALLRRIQSRLQLFDTRQGRLVPLPELLRPGGGLYQADVICVGELHDSEADHTVQRLILDALTYALFLELRLGEGVDPSEMRGRTPQNQSPQRVALGVEYFTRQQQATLDELIFGDRQVGPVEFQSKVNWDNVWAYDWSLYAPLFRFCQLNITRLVGLNLPYEAIQMISRGGEESLPDWLRAALPPLDLTQRSHRRRFENLFAMPLEDAVLAAAADEADGGPPPRPALDRAYQAQVLWDEYMADTARRYLEANGGRLVLFAGMNHVWRDAIPDRFERQARRASTAARPSKAVTVVPWRGSLEDPSRRPPGADFLLPMLGPGGGAELAVEVAAQRERLRGRSRVFPAGFL